MTRVLRITCAVLSPLLLATFPLLSLFRQNQTDVELSVLTWPLVLCLAGAAATFLVLLLLTRRTARASVLSCLLVVAFFYFGVLFDQGSRLTLGLWLLCFALAALLVLRTDRGLAEATVALAVAGAVMTAPQAVGIISWHHEHPSLSATDPRLWPSAMAAPRTSAVTTSPDIYVIIPDDYARTDVLRTYFGYDDSAFLKRLTDRGFTIDLQSRSPYSDSESNIASALNMDYLSRFPAVLGKNSEDVRPVKRVIEDNRAARLLTAVGYHYVHLDTDEVTFAGGNPDISPLAPPDSFANLWLRKTALHAIGGPVGFDDGATNSRYRRAIDRVFGQLVARRSSVAPQFVVFHTLLPHDPYVYSASGRPVTYGGHTDASLSSTAGRRAYIQQLTYLQSSLLRTVDAIRAHATTPPVIIIQADEGFQAEPDVFGEEVMQDIRVKGLTALALPGVAGLPDPPNTVNTLRFVLNHYLGTTYPMLPTASYPEGDLPYDFTPLTVR